MLCGAVADEVALLLENVTDAVKERDTNPAELTMLEGGAHMTGAWELVLVPVAAALDWDAALTALELELLDAVAAA